MRASPQAMRYHALACDYDGTLAAGGQVSEATVAALERLRESGRRLIMVTGRELQDLCGVFERLDLFDRVVAENGAVLYQPATRQERLLAEQPRPEFAEGLRQRGVDRLSCGRVIVATGEPFQDVVLNTIREMGLGLQVIFNKGAVMVLPAGVNKATGLAAALEELGLSAHNVVGIGDAENDHAFLSACECAVAVANALPALKDRADWVTTAPGGEGVTQLVESLLTADLENLAGRLTRHHILLGRSGGEPVSLPPYGQSILIAEPPGSDKSMAAMAIMERLAEHGYQFCLIDPEGDYGHVGGAVVLGDAQHVPVARELLQLLDQPSQSVIVSLLAVPLDERPAAFAELLPHVQQLRVSRGCPHWLILGEAHRMLPAGGPPEGMPDRLMSSLFITAHPDQLARQALHTIDSVIAIGPRPLDVLRLIARTAGEPAPAAPAEEQPRGAAALWNRKARQPPIWVEVAAKPRSQRSSMLRMTKSS